MKVIAAVLLLALTVRGWDICPIDEQQVTWGGQLQQPHPICNKFTTCTHGTPVVQTCPSPLVYNIKERVCDWPENVKCYPRVLPTPDSEEVEEVSVPSQPLLGPNGCPFDNNVHWLIPHELHCTRFYQCSNGERVLKKCPKFLFFNRILQVCDWPLQADCRSPLSFSFE